MGNEPPSPNVPFGLVFPAAVQTTSIVTSVTPSGLALLLPSHVEAGEAATAATLAPVRPVVAGAAVGHGAHTVLTSEADADVVAAAHRIGHAARSRLVARVPVADDATAADAPRRRLHLAHADVRARLALADRAVRPVRSGHWYETAGVETAPLRTKNDAIVFLAYALPGVAWPSLQNK